MPVKRRDFLKTTGQLIALSAFCGLGFTACLGGERREPVVTGATPGEKGGVDLERREAMFYEELEDGSVRCELCFRHCEIPLGERGFCRNRKNEGGTLYTLVYGLAASLRAEPVEKEPQHHYLPGTQILCVGTASCNFRCKFCHNWHLSQKSVEELGRLQDAPPAYVVEQAQKQNAPSISFTYNEPSVAYEYMYDVARLAQKQGVGFIYHTNGSLNEEPLQKLLPYVDSVTVDLKGYTDTFYRELSEAELEPVLSSLKVMKEGGVWLELVNLVIPTHNDDPESIRSMCRWIVSELGTQVPLHFSRFFPAYRLTDLAPTPVSVLEKAYVIAREEGLKFVSIGNVPGHKYNSSFCPECSEMLIERHHFTVRKNRISDGSCPACGYEVPGIWQ